MALINWDSSLSVSVSEIDQQHKKLVNLINDLSDAMKQGKAKDVIGKILDELINYTLTHFKLEEKYFDMYGYPEAVSHKKEHADFVKKVSEFKSGFEQGKLSVSIEVMNFLSGWLRNHIMGTDKKYSDFFHTKGLK